MLVFCKLGGSLITDKNQAHTARIDILARLAEEIAAARAAKPELSLVLGHGSGSFGHVPGKKYGTRQGVDTPQKWLGFVEVWQEARALNEIVLAVLQNAGLPVMAFPPSAAVIAENGVVNQWDLTPIQAALAVGIIPLVNGDTCFDLARGGTILSTEDLFFYLAPLLKPDRILLTGIEQGVWEDFPECTRLLKRISPDSIGGLTQKIHGSAATDVTGGMAEKVRQSLELLERLPGLRSCIFSGTENKNLKRALLGEELGTVICN